MSPQDELHNDWDTEPEPEAPHLPWGDHADESEPWYGNDTDGGEFYDGPSSPASIQYFEESRRGEESSTESEEMDVKESNNERKRKRDEEGNGEEDDDA